MKHKITLFAAALGLGLMGAMSTASAVPFEVCEFEGQTAHTYETVNRLTGWHLWECQAGNWQYVVYCGSDFICMV